MPNCDLFQGEMSLVVLAIDGGVLPRTSTATITIQISDIPRAQPVWIDSHVHQSGHKGASIFDRKHLSTNKFIIICIVLITLVICSIILIVIFLVAKGGCCLWSNSNKLGHSNEKEMRCVSNCSRPISTLPTLDNYALSTEATLLNGYINSSHYPTMHFGINHELSGAYSPSSNVPDCYGKALEEKDEHDLILKYV